jgi:hypothetical protein
MKRFLALIEYKDDKPVAYVLVVLSEDDSFESANKTIIDEDDQDTVIEMLHDYGWEVQNIDNG